ncbi:MAG: glycosyltransferase family 2 protein [Acinetobacter calcoaceticus]
MISIIVPVYNGEHYLRRNFESLMSQSCLDFEVIYINDGSVDNSEFILKELVRSHSAKCRLVSTKNQGVMLARKLGVSLAKFDYITFLDIDDILDCDFISTFISEIKFSNCDIICTNFKLSKYNKISYSKSLKENEYSNENFIKSLCVNGGWELCGKVYRKKIFDDIKYSSKISIGEDALVLFQLVFFSKNIKVLDNYLYTYIDNSNSASNVWDVERCRDGLLAGLYIKNFLMNKGVIDLKYLNSLMLLFFSNSLTRGLIKNNDFLFKELRGAINFNSLSLLPIKKRIIVIVGFILTGLNF